MKYFKALFCAWVFCITLILFSAKAFAYSQELASQVEENFFTYGARGSAYSNPHLRSDVLQEIMEYWEVNPTKDLLIYRVSNSNSDGAIYICDNIEVNNGVVSGGAGYRWTNCQWNNGNIFTFNSQTSVNNASGVVYDNTYLNMGTYEENNIDFSNIVYDPSIPTPVFSVTYNDDSSTMPRFNADIELKNASSDLYAYVTMDNETPISYGIAYDGNMYNKLYHKFPTRVLVSMDSLTVSDTLTRELLSGIVSSGWRADISTIQDTEVETYPISDGALWGESSAGYIAMKVQLLNLRKMALFYGNSNTISVQYFKIQNGRIFAGEIKSWNNLNGGVFTMTVPKYYQPFAPANGFEVVTIERPMETANPLTTIPENQFGYRTGGDITINVGSNVPNYPDYPTIASYNLDNLLVSVIDQTKNIGEFFSGVSAFCVATFAWIPAQIWQIVAIGFALSIVVMFIKIL